MEFRIYYYSREDKEGVYKGSHFGGSSIYFEGDKIILHDWYEHDNEKNDTVFEGSDKFIISRNDIGKILSLIPDEYKNMSILAKYSDSLQFYSKLTSAIEKVFFITVLRYFRKGKKFNFLLRVLNDNGIDYKIEDMRW